VISFMAAAASAAGQQGVAILSAGSMLEMFLWLIVVIAFILGCAWAFRRLNGGMLAPSGVIKIRSMVAVGSREKIALVEVGDKQILLGVCPTQINTLHVFDEPVIHISGQGEKANLSHLGFAAQLQSFLNKGQVK
jgi:flagellar protein FliO/FliZ